MIRDITRIFPKSVRLTITFLRAGEVDKWTGKRTVTALEVPDCVYVPGPGNEEAGQLHVEGMTGAIYTPVMVDVRHDDTGTIPAARWRPGPTRFAVVARPLHVPLGVGIPIREEP